MIGLQDFWVYLSSTPLLGLSLTLLAYIAAYQFFVWRHYAPWANPLMWATALVVAVLLVSQTDYRTYFEGAQFIHFLLGPSVVAMALLMWTYWPRIRRQAGPLLIASLAGGAAAVLSAVALAWVLGIPREVIFSLIPKSVTTPVAMGIGTKIGAEPSLVAAFVVMTGVTGAMIYRWVFALGRIRSDVAKGYALGTASHGIGTAAALQFSSTAGTYAALAMVLQSVLAALLIPLLFHLFIS